LINPIPCESIGFTIVMKQILPKEMKDLKVIPRGLDRTKVILNFLNKIGSGPVGAPGLKTAAEKAVKVIDVAQVSYSHMRCSRFDIGARREWKSINPTAKLSQTVFAN
jgi:hypothetical protein